MKFCTKCGNQMSDEMLFCQKCGAKDSLTEQIHTSANFGENKINTPIIKGIPKGVLVGIGIFLGLILFVAIINSTGSNDTADKNNNTAIVNNETKEEKKPEIPAEFAGECPVSVAVSMYDNIIGFPELKCNIKNNTDKEISAIQLYFLPKDVYGEEANGIFAQNNLQCDTPIAANGTDTVAWQMLDQSVKSGDLYVYSVYFSDGTEWGDRNASASKIKKYALKMNVSY